eukprot:3218844-Prymnesium_polylepis.3
MSDARRTHSPTVGASHTGLAAQHDRSLAAAGKHPLHPRIERSITPKPASFSDEGPRPHPCYVRKYRHRKFATSAGADGERPR